MSNGGEALTKGAALITAKSGKYPADLCVGYAGCRAYLNILSPLAPPIFSTLGFFPRFSCKAVRRPSLLPPQPPPPCSWALAPPSWPTFLRRLPVRLVFPNRRSFFWVFHNVLTLTYPSMVMSPGSPSPTCADNARSRARLLKFFLPRNTPGFTLLLSQVCVRK